MNNLFEVYLLQEVVTAHQWHILYQAMRQYSGALNSFEIIFVCKDNVVRYFVRSKHNLAPLSTNIDGVLLRPVNESELIMPETKSRIRFINFVTGGSLLDLKEKYHVKKSMELQYVIFNVRALTTKKAQVSVKLYFEAENGLWVYAKKKMIMFPAHLLSANFSTNTRYMHKTVPKYLNIEKSVHMLNSENINSLFSAETFPYFSHDYYLNITNYEFDKHSFIIGASGSGKSKFISLFVDRLQNTALNLNYRVIVIDPHASLVDDFDGMPNASIVTFDDTSTELFASSGADISASTELTATLFKSLLADQYNPRLDRMLRFSLYVLFTAQNMSLDMLKRFLTDLELRNGVLEHVREFVPPNITRFFGGDFNEIRTQFYSETIAPIISLVDEMQLQPALVGNGNVSLAKTVNDNFLTLFSLNKVKMGEKVVKTVSGLLIQQIFLLAQSRAFNQKVILIIDEVSVIQNPALAQILAEARKFNLFVFLTQQYFGQIEDDLKAAIFANVANYYVFRTSEEDARALEGNLNFELPKELIDMELSHGIKEVDVRVRMLTELNPRECIARLQSNGQLTPCIKLRTLEAPTRVTVTQNSHSLLAYEQSAETGTLPSKFIENTKLSPIPVVSPIVAQIMQTTAPPQMGMNLSQIMASQSSSRVLLHKRKEIV